MGLLGMPSASAARTFPDGETEASKPRGRSTLFRGPGSKTAEWGDMGSPWKRQVQVYVPFFLRNKYPCTVHVLK